MGIPILARVVPLLIAALAIMLSVWIITLACDHLGAYHLTAMPMAKISLILMWASCASSISEPQSMYAQTSPHAIPPPFSEALT